ncbi:CBS domain-containing protein, partial [bacterium]|nr:CBS domain-containing protein [bacterium]
MAFRITKKFLKELRVSVTKQDGERVRAQLDNLHNVDIAHVMNELEAKEAKFVYELLEEENAAEVMLELDEDVREKLLQTLTPKEIAEEIIENLSSDDAADVILELSDERQDEVLKHLEDEEQASDIADLLTHDENTAGGLMMKELVTVNVKGTMRDCVRQLREHAEEIENIYAVYVIDDDGKLLGFIELKKILVTNLRTPIRDVYQRDVIVVKATMDKEEVAQTMEKYDLV